MSKSIGLSHGSLNLETWSIDDLIPDPENEKIHTESQIVEIVKSLEKNDYVDPVIIDDKGVIIGGHGTVEAFRRWKGKGSFLQVINVGQKTRTQRTRARIALNKTNAMTGFDMYAIESSLKSVADELGSDFSGFGMLDEEIASFFPETQDEQAREEDEKPSYAGIKQIFLHFDPQEFEEFSKKCRDLAQRHGHSSVSEVVMGAVRIYFDLAENH